MSTRFYFRAYAPPSDGVAPAFAAWTRTDYGVRREMSTVGDRQAIDTRYVWLGQDVGANESSLATQYVSAPLAVGQSLTTAHTVKGVMQCIQQDAASNVDRQPLCLKVVSRDGTAERITLLPLAHYGPSTAEWHTGTGQNRQLADGDALQATYVTQRGDRLVLEMGGQVDATGATGMSALMNNGNIFGTSDLAENEVDTAAADPWFEISADLTFLVPDDSSGCLFFWRAGG